MSGRDLRSWMRRNSYTIESLAETLGVTERTIYRWRLLPEIPPHVELALEALESRRLGGHRAASDEEGEHPSARPRSA
ncbi:MAG: hypothetical protein GEU80_12995 [Dehalococcoidia bacterium]|nr:hypothetical protein [Dehalococcoidia bacterium]